MRTVSTGTLRVVTREDSGEYICEVSKYSDLPSFRESPTLERTPDSTFVRTGSTGILRHLHIVHHHRGLR